jgi:hypothetical protein
MAEMLKTPREFIADEPIEFYNRARTQTRARLFPQHRSLADEYCHRGFVYWCHSETLYPEFKPIMVARRAYFYYLDDLDAGRLKVESYEAFFDETETSDPTRAQRHPLPDAILNNKKLFELVRNVWPLKYLPYLEKIVICELYRGDGQIDNNRLAAILGVDVEVVRRALDCIRRKLQRHGFSGDMLI